MQTIKSTSEYPELWYYIFLTGSQSIGHKALKENTLPAVQFLQDKEARTGCKCLHWSEDGKPPPPAARKGSIPPECQREQEHFHQTPTAIFLEQRRCCELKWLYEGRCAKGRLALPKILENIFGK